MQRAASLLFRAARSAPWAVANLPNIIHRTPSALIAGAAVLARTIHFYVLAPGAVAASSIGRGIAWSLRVAYAYGSLGYRLASGGPSEAPEEVRIVNAFVVWFLTGRKTGWLAMEERALVLEELIDAYIAAVPDMPPLLHTTLALLLMVCRAWCMFGGGWFLACWCPVADPYRDIFMKMGQILRSNRVETSLFPPTLLCPRGPHTAPPHFTAVLPQGILYHALFDWLPSLLALSARRALVALLPPLEHRDDGTKWLRGHAPKEKRLLASPGSARGTPSAKGTPGVKGTTPNTGKCRHRGVGATVAGDPEGETWDVADVNRDLRRGAGEKQLELSLGGARVVGEGDLVLW